MRIVFIGSCLEPGQDGVGDYIRRLAAECVRQGHPSIILGLNDARISKPTLELQESDGTSISVLRLSTAMPCSERAKAACEWLEAFNPDWISLQYVCYGYHPKGLPWQWNPIFVRLGKMGERRHLMFHELWIGEGGYSTWMRRLIGIGQRWIIRKMYQRFQPDVVTTTMPLFQKRLARLGIMAKTLPLFGNIKITRRDDDRITSLLRAAGSRLVQKPRSAFLNGVFFGGVHPDFNVALMIPWLAELESRSAKPALLSMIGRAGLAGEWLARQLESSMPGVIEVVALGEQPEDIISQALQFADFGINTGSPEFLGKSGTFAAMREHGLPVVLADGYLDSTIQQNDGHAVFQFSTTNSVAAVLNYSRPVIVGSEVARAATNMVRYFESITFK